MYKKQKYFSQYRLLVFSFIIYMPLSFFLSGSAYSQLSYGGRPAVMNKKSIREIPLIRMPGFNPQRYLEEKMHRTDRRLKPLVFAKDFTINIDPLTDGSWEEMNDGTRVWRIALQSKGASSLNIIFSRFKLMPGVSVFLYNDDMSHILGAFDHRNNQISGSLATAPVKGDMLIVEMQVNKNNQDFGELIVGRLNHDFTGIKDTREGRFGLSGPCNIDINCPTGDEWQTQKNAVVRVTINGTVNCTGVLVNNTSIDGKPYLLTANHCITDSTDAENSVFVFGYESAFCNGSIGPVNMSLSGSDLLATQENLDFSLVHIREMPPSSYHPWYAGWDRSGATPDNTVSIHHPQGDVKKIAKDFDSPTTSTYPEAGYTADGHWQIKQWDYGTTENGSSGSPMFDQNGKLKGLLTGGTAKCGNAIEDYFCKFSMAWDNYDEDISSHLKPWLDSLDTGTESLHGINPYAADAISADFVFSTTEVCIGDKVVFTDFSSGAIDSWQWYFGQGANPAYAYTRGPHMVEYSAAGERDVSLTVTGTNGSDNMEKTFELGVKTTELPKAGFSYTENELSVQFHDMSENAVNYYWEFGDTRISTLEEPENTYMNDSVYTVKQLVRNRACMDTSIQAILVTSVPAMTETPLPELKVYPVPANNYIIIETVTSFGKDSRAELFSLTGQGLLKKRIQEEQQSTLLDMSRYPPGIYILTIYSGKEQITKKITILR